MIRLKVISQYRSHPDQGVTCIENLLPFFDFQNNTFTL